MRNLLKERQELLDSAEAAMRQAEEEGTTEERVTELYALAQSLLDKAEGLFAQFQTQERAQKMRDRTDELERASAPRPTISGPSVTRNAIEDMTDNEKAERSQLISAQLAFHDRSFTDAERALVDRTPKAEQLYALRLLAGDRDSPWRPAWDAVSNEDKLAVRAYAGGQILGNAADGGNIVPAAWYGEIVSERERGGPMFSNAVVNLVTKETETGQLIVPYNADTKAWDLVAVNEATDPAIQKAQFTQKTIGVTKYSRRTPISYELVSDNPFSIRSWITERIGDAVARGASKLFTTNGTQSTNANLQYPSGTLAVQGIIQGLPPNRTHSSAAATSFTINDALDAIARVDEDYLQGSRVMFQLHRNVAVAMRKETTQNLRAWSDADMTNGIPSMLHGFPVIYNPSFVGTLATGTVVGTFGDHGGYWGLVDGTPRVMSRYDDDGDQYIVTLYIRLGGRVIDPTSLIKLQVQ